MTPELYQWAERHGVSHQAMVELKIIWGAEADETLPGIVNVTTEAGAQSQVRLQAAQAGYLVWRNNVGAMEDVNGRVVRFGLCNDSAKVNKRIKSSDLVGIKPGGQFWCREMKPPGWHYTGTDREVAQLRFINLVTSIGGDAGFSTGQLTPT